MKTYLCLLAILLFGSAQSQIITGTIKDSLGVPIENAYIFNANSQSHAHTNELGNFSIDKTNKTDILNITAFGFKKKVLKLNSNDSNIVLESNIFKLDEIVIQPKVNALNLITKIDLQTTPVNSSQEILIKVPGLIIGQHAGGGKAEQIFLRGFDIDHGTDIAINVDGMPVNMVSHAHGQGYADLHFVIPETVEKIDFGKGPYDANKGDFATAGHVGFQTKERLLRDSFSVEAGQFNTLRSVGLFNLLEKNQRQNAYVATEYILSDGSFESPQNFSRMNIFGKYTNVLANNSKVSFTASRFYSKWDASGQIPKRLVDNGTISRFGAVDNTEGGNTSRTNLNVAFIKPINESTFFTANAFYSKYTFELFSNFTFFLENPVNGDQIKQKEDRNIYGLNSELNKKFKFNSVDALFQIGFGFIADATVDSELSRTLGRFKTLENIQLGDVDQSSVFSYLNTEFNFGKLIINPAIRFDNFKFSYQDKLLPTFISQTADKLKFSPKLNFVYTENNNFQLFLKSGYGFHSNDARVVVAQTGELTLPSAFGADFGSIFKPFPKLVVNTALWYLFSEQEFAYVGDVGIVEPSGRSRRMGVDLGLRYQLANWLFLDTDVNYTHARSIDEPKGQDFISLAPDFTTTGGLSVTKLDGFSGGLRYRYLKNRPANEDNSIVAKGYIVSDFNINYDYKKMTFGIAVENIFNTAWNETQFATESRLQNEPTAVEEIHFTPGTPFFVKAKITYSY